MEFKLHLTDILKEKINDFLEERDDGSKLDAYLVSLFSEYEGLEEFLTWQDVTSDYTIMPTIKGKKVILKREVI